MNIWKSKRKALSLPVSNILTMREYDKEACKKWVEEVNFGKCFTEHQPFEDTNLVKDAMPVSEQMKIAKIRQYQKKFIESLKHE